MLSNSQEYSSQLESEVTTDTACSPICERPVRMRPIVLSVDDDEANQMVIESILTPECEVHIVMDGITAIEYLLKCSDEDLPDCVLLDVMMPGMSGFEVCKKVRHEMGFDATELPILMLSANPSTAALSKGFESGCNDYITKPFDKQVLRAHISAATLRQARSETPTTATS